MESYAVVYAALHAPKPKPIPIVVKSVCDFADTAVPTDPGTIFMNPEYGERLGEREALKPLYRRIGAWLGDHAGRCHTAILTASPMLAKETGLKPVELIQFFNGPIDCRLVRFS